jgi:hypothetical protein
MSKSNLKGKRLKTNLPKYIDNLPPEFRKQVEDYFKVLAK